MTIYLQCVQSYICHNNGHNSINDTCWHVAVHPGIEPLNSITINSRASLNLIKFKRKLPAGKAKLLEGKLKPSSTTVHKMQLNIILLTKACCYFIQLNLLLLKNGVQWKFLKKSTKTILTLNNKHMHKIVKCNKCYIQKLV